MCHLGRKHGFCEVVSCAQVSFAHVPLPFALGNRILCSQLPTVSLRVAGQQHTKEICAAEFRGGVGEGVTGQLT